MKDGVMKLLNAFTDAQSKCDFIRSLMEIQQIGDPKIREEYEELRQQLNEIRIELQKML